MKNCQSLTKIQALLVGLLLPVILPASDYTYIEGGYVNIDRKYLDDDSGIRLHGSADIARNFNLFGEFSDTGDIEQFTAGGQFHTPVSPLVDLTAGASYENLEVGPFDDNGFGLRASLRWREAGGHFDLNPEIRHLNVFDETDTSLRLGALVPVAPRLNIQGAIQAGDDDRFEAGMRYVF